MNPLDALSSMMKVQAPVVEPGAQPMPMSPPITEGFNLVQPQPVNEIANSVASVGGSGGGSPTTWGHMVQQMVMDVNSKQQTAAQKISDVLQGGPTPVHEAMVASEEASLSFEFMSEMRNKIVESYQTIMQMQV